MIKQNGVPMEDATFVYDESNQQPLVKIYKGTDLVFNKRSYFNVINTTDSFTYKLNYFYIDGVLQGETVTVNTVPNELTTVYIDTPLTTMDQMFAYITTITYLDLSHLNTSKVSRLYRAFYGCENLEVLNFEKNNINNCNNITNCFRNCKKLKKLHINKIITHTIGDEGYYAENFLNGLNTLEILNFGNNDSSIFIAPHMTTCMTGCNNLKTIYYKNDSIKNSIINNKYGLTDEVLNNINWIKY